MSEEQEIEPVVVAKPPLFTLDLGANGGVLAPTSVEELQEWVQREFDFWTWTQNVSTGNHKSALDQAWNPLNSSAVLPTHWVLSHSVRRSPSQAAIVACISSGLWFSRGIT